MANQKEDCKMKQEQTVAIDDEILVNDEGIRQNFINLITEMSVFEVEPPETLKTGREKRVFPKLCYEKSYEYYSDKFMDIYSPKNGGLFVNGVVGKGLLAYGHAWVEIENSIVFDGVLQRFYDKDTYYRYYNVGKTFKFPPNKIHELMKGSNFEYVGYYPSIENEVWKENVKEGSECYT